MSTQTPEVATGLEPYRKQARELEEALAKVRAIQDQTVAVTLQRQTVLERRQGLLDNWENETAVAELSKLASRVEMAETKLASLASQLAGAEAELKAALAGFAISYNALFLTLRTFLIKGAAARIATTLHPKVRQISGASIAEIAALSTEVVDFESLAVRGDPMASMHNNQLPPDAIQRDAERALPKAEPLLAEAAKHLDDGFVPPVVFSLET